MKAIDPEYYKRIIKSIGFNKRLGQNFLLDDGVAKAEAVHVSGKRVLELGPGLGILTRRLCEEADFVTAIEIDKKLSEFLSANLNSKNLKLINEDFFEVADRESKNADIVASNVPYQLSSKLLFWISRKGMPAVLCLQKEFVNRMMAQPGTNEYSRLSVFCSLQFRISEIMGVPSSSFYPPPKVDSKVVYLKPKGADISEKSSDIISLIMEHKNKKLRNAIQDSSSMLGLDKAEARKIADSFDECDSRVFTLSPEALLNVSNKLSSLQKE
jgi:16S rRNA (adenine1518-N6/adenine1519-N6)-dimethyltransferase